MNVLLDLLKTLFAIAYYWLAAIFLTIIRFLPLRSYRKDVTQEVVLVTGAGSGIGRLMAVKFAKLGSLLVLWDISKEGNEETAREIKKYGGRAYTYTIDLCNREAVYKTAEKVKQEVGTVTILINNAGIVTGKKFLESSDELIQKTVQVNTMAHFWTAKSFLPAMMEKNHGHLVTIASSAGLVGVTGLADYCASKFAAVGFHEAISQELIAQGKDGIHSTVVCPYYIDTGMFDGVKSRFPWILPIVNQEDATNIIVDAVLTNQEMVMMPKLLYFSIPLKLILPVKCTLALSKFFGLDTLMNTFKGRQKRD